jgi:exodeoxyribonuclease V alpha subunit
MERVTPLDALRAAELLDAADLRLVAWLRDRARPNDGTNPADAEALTWAVAALCRACAEGGLCLPLAREGLRDALGALLSAAGRDDAEAKDCAARFLDAADAGRFDAVLGDARAPNALVRDHGNLYLHRYWFAERAVAAEISRRARGDARVAGAASAARALDEILRDTLEKNPLRGPDGGALTLTPPQREALRAALFEPVFVLSGGPGTGKTTWTAAWIRALMRLPGASPERVRLCAPTGRAARRLAESLRARLGEDKGRGDAEGEDAADHAARAVPVTTLHGLLGYRAFEGGFARGPGDPIDADWILLDEASMTDVFLLATLLRAMRPDARLVLVGDPDQLPPVEAGSVLAELLPDAPGVGGPVPSVTLDAGHRSSDAVAALAAAVRAGDADAAMRILGEPKLATPLAARMREYAAATFGAASEADGYAALLESFRKAERAEEAGILERLWSHAGKARVLAPLRRGPVSAEAANRALRALLEPVWRRPSDARGLGFHGAPILVTRNDERVGLSNGDVGLWLEAGDGATVFFPDATAEGGWLRVPVALLPPHELGFATTVHKSQGSEYDTVWIVLPDAGNTLLARETLYTAITRARREARVFATEAAIREAVGRRLRRPGGLRAALAAGEER